MAANIGNDKALRHLYQEYHFGGSVSKNQAQADKYLNLAAHHGSEWAMLLLAQKQEQSAPATAFNTYLKVARNDNCAAQFRVSQAYMSGGLVDRNLTQAYFWLLLANVNKFNRTADVTYKPASGFSYWRSSCFTIGLELMGLESRLEKTLPPKLVQAAQNSATAWRKGTSEKMLPAPVIAADEKTPPTAETKEPPKVATITPPSVSNSPPKPPTTNPAASDVIQSNPWIPVSKKLRPPRLPDHQVAEELFTSVRSSVWIVFATTSTDKPTHVSQGSAVAISHSHLLTNCHVIDNERFVFIKQGEKVLEATVVTGDKDSDRCVLQVREGTLKPVNGLRDFGELHVGEQVYTIGSPSALESTLAQGIVSGLRTVSGRHLIQTTAPISSGSSGGGLFDDAGNLIGITSFILKNSQGLNFAIAAEDYFH
jgi:S1-C subfamily serine protease